MGESRSSVVNWLFLGFSLSASCCWCPRAVAGLNTPYKPANPNVDVMEMIKARPVFDYQLYFQEPVSTHPRSKCGPWVLVSCLPEL